MHIIYNYIINVYYNYYICNKDLLEERDKQQNMAVTGAATVSCSKEVTVKRSVQCHVLVQSPPGRRSNDKYPVNTLHGSDWSKNV
jgi:hypothetical protein